MVDHLPHPPVIPLSPSPPPTPPASPPLPPTPVKYLNNATSNKTFTSVLNLSNHILTPSQSAALELGLKFAPSPTTEPDLLEFFDKFEQSCSWAMKRVTGGQIPTLPKVMVDRLALMKQKLSDIEHFDYPSNITPDVRRAILQLKNNQNLVIRQADKGSCIVIADRDNYIAEGLEHLADSSTYVQSPVDRTLEIAQKANWTINHYNTLGIISDQKKIQLLTDTSQLRTQILYFLRKVHKHPHQLRPIVSASSGPTEKISGLMTQILGAYLEDITSLVRNSVEVVNHLEGLDLQDSPDLFLVSFDVTSLYPSIPQGPGIEIVLQRVCPTQPPTSREIPYKNMLRDLLRLILRENHFCFNNLFFTQKCGVAMGTKCAPHLANLFMASVEEGALSSWTGTQPTQWTRFIDDIFMIWKGSREELTRFHTHLNNQMNSIKFTMEASQESAVFLDLKIYKGHRFLQRGILDTSLHIKDTNPQCFLHFSSCHPFSTFKTVLRGEIIRALRCTSSPTHFIKILDQLLQKFKARGYPPWLLRQTADDINHSKRAELLHPPERRGLENDVALFTSIFSPGVSSSSIRRALEDEQTPFSPMILRPRPTSIQDKLVRARISSANLKREASTSKQSTATTSSASSAPSTSAHLH